MSEIYALKSELQALQNEVNALNTTVNNLSNLLNSKQNTTVNYLTTKTVTVYEDGSNNQFDWPLIELPEGDVFIEKNDNDDLELVMSDAESNGHTALADLLDCTDSHAILSQQPTGGQRFYLAIQTSSPVSVSPGYNGSKTQVCSTFIKTEVTRKTKPVFTTDTYNVRDLLKKHEDALVTVADRLDIAYE